MNSKTYIPFSRIMPPCSVTGCTSGRKGSEKVQTFKYPSDDIMKKKWLKLIGKNTVGKDAVVCKKHFALGYLIQEPENPFTSLHPKAVPTLFDFGPPKKNPRKPRKPPEIPVSPVPKKPRIDHFEHNYGYRTVETASSTVTSNQVQR